MTLKGHAAGLTRQAIINEATEAGRKYFQRDDITVRLSNERAITVTDYSMENPHVQIITGYEADWEVTPKDQPQALTKVRLNK